jgi:hypothetical protein
MILKLEIYQVNYECTVYSILLINLDTLRQQKLIYNSYFSTNIEITKIDLQRLF